MAAPKIPGTRGAGFEQNRSRTLARNANESSSISSFHKKDLEGTSNCIENVSKELTNSKQKDIVVGEIFFATNEYCLNTQDTIVLNRLTKNIKELLNNGYHIHLYCTGGADYRGLAWNNRKLGYLRAESVERYIKNSIDDVRLTISVKTIGESGSPSFSKNKKSALKEIMKDRKVEISVRSRRSDP